MNIKQIAPIALAGAFLTGCATDDTYETAAFGEANRQTYAAMIVNPEPEYDTEMETSGEKAADAAQRYYDDKVKEPDTIRSTSGSGGPGE